MEVFTDVAQSTLASGITNVATSLTVATGEGVKFPAINSTQDFFEAWLETGPVGAPTTMERILVTARATDVFTIVRAQEGTSGFAFSTADRIYHGDTARSQRQQTADILVARAMALGIGIANYP